MRANALFLLALVGCQEPVDPSEPDPSDSDTGTTASPTGPFVPPPGCESLPTTATLEERLSIQTEEDFDFDAVGNAVYQQGAAVVGTSLTGQTTAFGAGFGGDPSGIQVAPDGRIIVLGQDSNVVYRLDPATGGIENLLSSLQHPNGLEVSRDGIVYVSDFVYDDAHITWYDPASGDSGSVLRGLNYPNGLALSPDEQRLYVVAMRPSGKHVVLYSDRTGDDWGPRTTLFASWDVTFDGIETDGCGNVYVLDYTHGDLMRIDPTTGETTTLITLTDDHPSEYFSSLRWGSGVGGWKADRLYVTDRAWLYPLDVGAPPRPPASVAR